MYTVLPEVLYLESGAARSCSHASPNLLPQKIRSSYHRPMFQLPYGPTFTSFLCLTMRFSDKVGEISDPFPQLAVGGELSTPLANSSEVAVRLMVGPVGGTALGGFSRQAFFLLSTAPVFSLLSSSTKTIYYIHHP